MLTSTILIHEDDQIHTNRRIMVAGSLFVEAQKSVISFILSMIALRMTMTTTKVDMTITLIIMIIIILLQNLHTQRNPGDKSLVEWPSCTLM